MGPGFRRCGRNGRSREKFSSTVSASAQISIDGLGLFGARHHLGFFYVYSAFDTRCSAQSSFDAGLDFQATSHGLVVLQPQPARFDLSLDFHLIASPFLQKSQLIASLKRNFREVKAGFDVSLNFHMFHSPF